MRQALWVIGLCWLLAGCASTPLPGLEQELRRLERPVLLADLEQTAGDLGRGPEPDRARLALVPGLVGDPLPLEPGWLLTLEREERLWLCWLAAPRHTGEHSAGQAELLSAGQELKVLDLLPDRVLVLEHDSGPAGQRRLVACVPGRGREVLAEAPADRLRPGADGSRLLLAEERPAPHFRESAGSWHLEQQRPILRRGSGWELGKAEPAETPYRSLVRFVAAARDNRWRLARREVVLEKLLALPGGGFSRELAASLRLGTPALLEPNRPLLAPPQGEILRFGDVAGHSAWRVRIEPRQGRDGLEQWKLVRLETVEKP